MTEYSFKQFVSSNAPDITAALDALPAFPTHLTNCLLSGPPRSGKTCLLFHFALSAAEGNRPVVCICNREKLEDAPFLLPPGVSETSPLLHNIKLKYLTTIEEVQKYAACLHLLDPLPCAVVVDGLSNFEFRAQDKRARDFALIKTLAQLHEAAEFVRTTGAGCSLVVADTGTDAGPPALFLFQKWFPLVLVATGRALHVLPQCAEWCPLGQLADVAVQYSLGRSYMAATALTRR